MTRNHPRPHISWLILPVLPVIALLVLASCFRHQPAPLPMATLSGCTICHVDVADAFAASKHRRKGIDCIRCHGVSRRHIEDENNKVKPDRIFTRREIDRWCDGCHQGSCKHGEGDKVLPAGVRWRTCGDCHGSHSARIPGRNAANPRCQTPNPR